MPVKAFAPAVPAVGPAELMAFWAHGFGDYENRQNIAPNSPVALDRTTRTWGVVGGVDVTVRGIDPSGGNLILGLLGGYSESRISFSSGNTSARLEGPSVGAYTTYFSGPFSADLTFKADLLSLTQSFSEFYPGNPAFPPVPMTVTGSGSADVTNLTLAGNLFYKIPLGRFWIEPTAGFQYINTSYSNVSANSTVVPAAGGGTTQSFTGAAALGLENGEAWRLQGGARFGTDWRAGSVLITPTFTALLYSFVSVSGFVVEGSGFGPTLVSSDEGKARFEGIGTLNFDFGNGIKSFVQGEFRTGEDLFGAGGKVGIRIAL
jgi:outer membrane autotransporter protein